MAPSRPLDDSTLNEICPVCKSSRYLNPSLSFLINSECYHTMCTSCVDRLFTSGPAPCPVAGCHKTLRKRGFHPAFFADLSIEREVDVRKRVSAVFNRRQEDFASLRDWNDYLESVEDLVFRLTSGSPQEKKEAEQALKEYSLANARLIAENDAAEKAEEDLARRAQAAQEARRKQRREEAARREREEREDLRRTREEVLERLAQGDGDAEEITRRMEREIHAKTARLRAAHLAEERADRNAGLAIRGELKARQPLFRAEEEYDSFGGLDLTPTRFVVQKSYNVDWLEAVKREQQHMVGGYSVREYYERALLDAFSGLAVFVQEEKGERPDALKAERVRAPMMEYDDGF